MSIISTFNFINVLSSLFHSFYFCFLFELVRFEFGVSAFSKRNSKNTHRVKCIDDNFKLKYILSLFSKTRLQEKNKNEFGLEPQNFIILHSTFMAEVSGRWWKWTWYTKTQDWQKKHILRMSERAIEPFVCLEVKFWTDKFHIIRKWRQTKISFANSKYGLVFVSFQTAFLEKIFIKYAKLKSIHEILIQNIISLNWFRSNLKNWILIHKSSISQLWLATAPDSVCTVDYQ